MAKKPVYKTGKRNPNAYHDIRKIKERAKLAGIIILILFCLLIALLSKLNIINLGGLLNRTDIIDTVNKTESAFAVYYLDVGQGDCSIITSGEQTMIIDASTYAQVDKIEAALKSLNIQTVDYFVITHQHDDHIGSAAWIVNNHNVKNVIMPKLSEENMVTTAAYEELLNAIAENDVKAIAAEPGLHFTLGEATVNIFAPIEQEKNLNNMSVVLKVIYGKTSFLFQGDAEKKIENALLRSDCDLSADIIKVGHHGSNTSSGDKYIKAVAPKAAVMSCGAGNDYKHPHIETLETLDKYGTDKYITYMSGDITAVSDGKTIKISTEKSDEVKIYE